MKLLIVSDIHGSAQSAHTLKDAFTLHGCDRILLLGDLLYHGPRNPLPAHYNPVDVIAVLNELSECISAVRGNCDSEVDQMVLHFPIQSDSATIEMEGYKIVASHGHIYNPENLPPLNPNDVFAFGHIHIPVMEEREGVHIINPGSITLPKENTPPSYGIIQWRVFTLFDVQHRVLSNYNF